MIEKIKETLSSLSERKALERVILFGSYAKNKYTVGSDIDIFIVFDESKIAEDKIYKNLMKVIKLPRVELHILSKKDYELMKSSKWVETIMVEGIKII
ncbi:MAG: nucleotidyltransferase domain-containing protein [Thermoproteota archaeon]